MANPLRDDPLTAVEADLLQQKAATLARISGTLTTLIGELDRRLASLEALPVRKRQEELASLAEVHRRAQRYFWYVMVQREALGLRRHDRLAELYPIPDLPA